MILEILSDLSNGILNSIRVDAIIYYLIASFKMANIMFKVCVCEILMLIAINVISMFSSSQDGGLVIYALKIINGVFIFLSTAEFIGTIDIVDNNKKGTVIDIVSTIMTMSIYQLSMMLLVNFINYVLFSTASIVINFFILTIYHSFYAYNNLWQKKGIKISARVNIYECRWAYYAGLGILPTIIYLNSYNIYIASLYNLYLFLLIMVPFYVKEPAILIYPKINLKVFTYVCEWMIYLVTCCR
jgi:hypothetical protein